MFEGKNEIETVLNALSEQLEAEGIVHLEMLVCGGTALNILGYISRRTEDVDVVAFIDRTKDGLITLAKASPLRSELVTAARRVQRDFNLPDNWLNGDPAHVMDFGLPQGLMDRVETRHYGKNLTIHFLSRYDQIHFKLYATADWDRRDVHFSDLIALKPKADELGKAARWCLAHDTSETFKLILKDLLGQIGYKDVAKKL